MIEIIKNIFGLSRTFGVARSDSWNEFRKNFLKTHSFCEFCSTTKDLELHHIKPFHKFPLLELEPQNIITLCHDHHFDWGHFRDWSSWNENIRMDAKIWLERIKNKPH